MNDFLEVLRAQCTRIGLKINVKKTKSRRLGISEGDDVMLGNEKIDLVDSFTYLISTISKAIGFSEDVKIRNSQGPKCFFTVENSLEE